MLLPTPTSSALCICARWPLVGELLIDPDGCTLVRRALGVLGVERLERREEEVKSY